MKNDQWVERIDSSLGEISSALGIAFSEQQFDWDAGHEVAKGPDADKTLISLFGHGAETISPGFWTRMIRRGPSLKLNFLGDGVVFIKPRRQRLILASRGKDLLIKAVVRVEHFELIDEEASFLRSLARGSFSGFVPRLRGTGLTSTGIKWLATDLADNSHSLLLQNSPEEHLLTEIETFILSPLAHFYRSQTPATRRLQDYLQLARTRAEKHPQSKLLENFIGLCEEEAKDFPGATVTEVMLHFDLHAGNILTNGQKTIFIDWEVHHRGALEVDVFDAYRRVVNKDPQEAKALFTFLTHKGDSPVRLKKLHSQFMSWSKKEFQSSPSEDEGRLAMLLFALERTLLYFEKWKVDRIRDQKGLEARIIALNK